MARRTTVYLTDRLDSILQSQDNTSGALHRFVDRYHEIVRRSRDHGLTEDELAVLEPLVAYWNPDPAAAIADGFALAVEDAVARGLTADWLVSPAQLIAKLRGLSFAQQVALLDIFEMRRGRRAGPPRPVVTG